MQFNKNRIFLNILGLCLSLLVFLACSCSTPSATQVTDETGSQGILEAIAISTTPEKSTIIMTTPGVRTERKAYTLTDPPRICVDILGNPAEDLSKQFDLEEGPVEKILIQDRRSGHTGVVVYVRPEEYKYRLSAEEDKILLTVTPVGPEKFEARKPVSPKKTDLSHPKILNVAVTERPSNGTRLSIETNRQIEHDIKLDGNILLIDFKNATAVPHGIKALEADPSGGAIKGIRAFYSPQGRNVLLKVALKGLVPYHVTREETQLIVDFDAIPDGFARNADTSITTMPPQRENLPALPKATAEPVKKKKRVYPLKKHSRPEFSSEEENARLLEASSRDYAGQRMSFDFVDTDIRNILNLIAEVTGINVVWGPEVQGKISMRLQNVPWDQALEMVLRPNGLTYMVDGDVLWVAPRTQLLDMELQDKKRRVALLGEKRSLEMLEAKVIEFVTIKNRQAYEIYTLLLGGDIDIKEVVNGKLIIKTRKVPPLLLQRVGGQKATQEGEEEGSEEQGWADIDLLITYDTGTNTIVLNGVRSKIQKVKELIEVLDTPEKQVMVEARIVDAATTFARDLGVEWQSLDGENPGIERKWFNSDGTSRFGGSFSTNAPSDAWTPNIGLAFGWLTDGGLGSLALDASIALAEQDGKAKVISAPKVLTVNGELAQIMRGDVAFFEVATLEQTDVKEISAVLSLNVIPTVSGDGKYITMLVLVTDSKMYPDLSGRTEKAVSANMVIKSGDTAVIGGIYRESTATSDSGVPWLKDIPILGYLFKAETETKEKHELLIFLTPTVVDNQKM